MDEYSLETVCAKCGMTYGSHSAHDAWCPTTDVGSGCFHTDQVFVPKQEDKPMREFKSDVTMRTLLEHSPCIDALKDFMDKAGHTYVSDDLFLSTPLCNNALNSDPEWVVWADNHNLLEPEEESVVPESVRLGDVFLIGASWYMLAQVDNSRVALIGLRSGNRYVKATEVHNLDGYTLRKAVQSMVRSAESHNEIAAFRRNTALEMLT